ncbi:Uma2 family endonuclease [Roseofilum sp. BLCC_M154]|uniref:Uma2 family endonuclease n=1 Tax=Roseofilum acuticapitatum BLCC-M154 TaxID=3022444 RepID=A0ABT7AZ06_9CYAN|nr:Uma2 family endonuclease [Roseofilum acuticapitatum]MDJ1172134.1 Uma2 family endonuclease [Roseofilum acuticapitatum BLCC-M154]
MNPTSLKSPLIYPEPDGAPMAESDPARDYLVYGVESLKFYFQERSDVYVSGNLWLSYEQGVPDAVVCPDVFVVFGVENRPRRSYRVWEENNRYPDWVLEVTSMSTRHKDERDKPVTYAQMGVTEYFQYDPSGDYLQPRLRGRRLVNGEYQLLTLNELADGTLSVFSPVLGLEMRVLPDGKLRFFDRESGEYLRSPDESERDRLQERQRAEQAELALEEERRRAQQAEAKLQALRQRLLEQGIDPSTLE